MTASPGTRPVGLAALPRLVLFDLDGTLAHTLPDIAAAIDDTLTDLGFQPAGGDLVREWVGHGMARLVERALTHARHGSNPDPATLTAALELYHKNYAAREDRATRLFPGVLEVLRDLQNRSLPMGCVTNKPLAFTRPLLERLNLTPFFGLVLGGDSLPRKKPDPAPLLHAAQHFGIAARESLMVGDSQVDIKAARGADMPVVAVTFGYESCFVATPPDTTVDSFAELNDLLLHLAAR